MGFSKLPIRKFQFSNILMSRAAFAYFWTQNAILNHYTSMSYELSIILCVQQNVMPTNCAKRPSPMSEPGAIAAGFFGLRRYLMSEPQAATTGSSGYARRRAEMAVPHRRQLKGANGCIERIYNWRQTISCVRNPSRRLCRSMCGKAMEAVSKLIISCLQL